MRRTALVTGHGGFLGGHMARRLLGVPGLRVAGLARRRVVLPGARSLAVDLRDADATRRAVLRLKPRWIFHLAGRSSGAALAPLLEAHLAPTANVLAAAAALPGPVRVVLAGSAAEYGRIAPDRLPARESEPARPVTAYGAVKLAQTSMGSALARAGLDVVIARVFNVLGPGLPLGLSAASFTRQIAEMERGWRPGVLAVGNLSPRRDFVAASEVADALWSLARRGRTGEVYNVCSGRSVSIRALVARLGREARLPGGGRPRVETLPGLRRSRDLPDMRGSWAKIAAHAGWRPRLRAEEILPAMLAHDRRVLAAAARRA